jgi:hypothetical protein
LLELDGRLAEALPVRPLVPADGRLVVVGRLLTVGRLVVPLAVGRLMLPGVLPLTEAPALVRPDMLPPLVRLWRPLFGKLWLIEPLVPLPWRTLAT